MASEPMWCVVMFDLPTKTAQDKREYSRFRNSLLDIGFSRVQYSVYAHYSPTGLIGTRLVKAIKANLPVGGEVRIYHLTDKQWAKAIRFSNHHEELPDPEPEQLMIF
ncbi:CRISPR-associated endonuclease Cas2 [Arcanobacterium bovis]|uniref:CRISPR-associated endoribonuclease Cas2 n=2 Tax=Arcanobacterium bovis TaxID=2529275 RepID=A0A4Q9V0F3_9ACTO|nr:CRISPR-associated endonuclease Cas2 [Arcanobacterium bovis]TBW20916.1 CRISPR-associated endonuclease Cas2 [Arcanobacterium bovis]